MDDRSRPHPVMVTLNLVDLVFSFILRSSKQVIESEAASSLH